MEGAIRVPEANAIFAFHVLEREVGETLERWRMRTSAAGRANANEARFDFDQLRMPLTIRNRRDGDRMEPHGLNGSKKVKNMFIDAKVPRRLRNAAAHLVDGDGRILWIPGLRRARHADVTGETERILLVQVTTDSKD